MQHSPNMDFAIPFATSARNRVPFNQAIIRRDVSARLVEEKADRIGFMLCAGDGPGDRLG